MLLETRFTRVYSMVVVAFRGRVVVWEELGESVHTAYYTSIADLWRSFLSFYRCWLDTFGVFVSLSFSHGGLLEILGRGGISRDDQGFEYSIVTVPHIQEA